MSRSTAGGSLPRYVAQRLLLVIPTVWLLVSLVFLLLRVAPGDPVSALVGGHMSTQALNLRRHSLGLDQPLIAQYGDYLKQVVTFRFGTTISDNRPVIDVIRDNGGATLTLTLGAFFFALLIGIPLGLFAGRRRDSLPDAVVRIFGVVSYAAPIFWTGLMLVLLITPTGWPTYGIASAQTQFFVHPETHILLLDCLLEGNLSAFWDVFEHHLLPCFTLGVFLSGVFIRLVRVNLLQTLQADYVEAARARGVRERYVVRRHAFRNALVPVITVIGLQVALTMSGAVLTERTFNWPGIGNQLVNYLNERDYPAVQGLVTFFAVVVVIVSLLVDIVNALVDPRIRY